MRTGNVWGDCGYLDDGQNDVSVLVSFLGLLRGCSEKSLCVSLFLFLSLLNICHRSLAQVFVMREWLCVLYIQTSTSRSIVTPGDDTTVPSSTENVKCTL